MRRALAGHGAMMLYAVLVAGSFSLGHIAAPMMDPAALNGLRFILAALFIGAVVAAGRTRRSIVAAARAPWRYLILGGLLAAYFVLMFVALRLTDAVSTGTVFTLAPAMTAVLGWWLLRQRTTAHTALALAVGAAGAVWVIFRGDAQAMLAFRVGRGEALFLLGCAAHALFTPLSRRLNRGETPALYSFWIITASALILVLIGAEGIARSDLSALPAAFWLVLGYLAVFPTAGSFVLLQFASMRLPAAKVMAWTYFVPSCIVLWEGLLGRGWVAPEVAPGIALTAAALVMLLRHDPA
ncbi:MAG: DMT family transporter, partial [Alphaproteobacteria bacterium]